MLFRCFKTSLLHTTIIPLLLARSKRQATNVAQLHLDARSLNLISNLRSMATNVPWKIIVYQSIVGCGWSKLKEFGGILVFL